MIKKAIVNAITQELSEQKAHFSNVEIEESKFGDYSTSFPLKLGKFKDYQNPQEVAKFFVSELSKNPLFSEVTVSEPGFINFTINQKEAASLLREVIGEGESFGKNKKHKGKKARVEFVSANPTGPLHIGNARGGPLGDTISNVLEASGYEVLREYINNDRGNQIQELGLTVAVRAGFIQEDQTLTYTGEYINELADKVKEQLSIAGLNKEQIVAKCGEIGSTLLYKDILKVCEEMRIEFDLLVSESELQEKLPQILKDLKDKDLLVEKEGATWFKMGEQSFEDKEAVVIKSDGSYTYFASDIAYHLEKFNSDYDLVFDVFGSNTSGHVPKLQALAKAANFDLEKFKVVLYQFVRVVKGKEIVKMSKRAGNFVTAEEVLREVGKDAFRFMMLLFSPNTHMDFDLDLARKQSNENPVYYVQYAHSRVSSILAKAEIAFEKFDPALLKTEGEKKLTRKILEFPDLVAEISENFQVHHLTHYTISVADLFHKFYESNKVLSEDQELTKARLALVSATQIVLRNSLKLLGVSAPEKM